MIEFILGSVQLFPYYGAPRGWMPCDGRLLPIASYNQLYALIGNTYGQGTTDFPLPNYTNDSPEQGMAYYICVEGVFPQRN